MSGALRDWILSLAGAAAVCSLAMCVTPAGRVKKVLGVVCGMVMAVALLSPVMDFDFDTYAAAMAVYRDRAEGAASAGEEVQNSMVRSIIQARCAAYILDKAEAMGMTGAVEVLAVWSAEDSVFVPFEAVLELRGDGRAALADKIASELGIPEERQYWRDD